MNLQIYFGRDKFYIIIKDTSKDKAQFRRQIADWLA
jgi:hypothetical protein